MKPSGRPKLSIITVTYNDAEGLEKTINSLGQMRSPVRGFPFAWEHVIVDSSPDLNGKIFDALETSWPVVHVKEPPKGIYAAMNAGVVKAEGELLWFLNGGDELLSLDALEKVVAEFDGEETFDVVVAGAKLFRDGKFQYPFFPKKTWAENLLGMNQLCHQAMVYRLRSFMRVGLFTTRFKIAGDYEHHFRSLIEGLRLRTIDAELVAFARGGQSDDVFATMHEFKKVHAFVANRLSKKFQMQNRLLWARDYARLLVIKNAAKAPVIKTLKPVWYWIKRLTA